MEEVQLVCFLEDLNRGPIELGLEVDIEVLDDLSAFLEVFNVVSLPILLGRAHLVLHPLEARLIEIGTGFGFKSRALASNELGLEGGLFDFCF